MIVIDGEGIPLGVHLDSASPHEMSLVDKTLATIVVLEVVQVGQEPDQ